MPESTCLWNSRAFALWIGREFQPVHAKSMASQEVRALLVGRKQLLGRLIDVELSIRGILRGFGLKVGSVTRKGFEARFGSWCKTP